MTEGDPSPEARFTLDWPETTGDPAHGTRHRPAAMRLSWEEPTDSASSGPGERHDACRQEIARLEALVAELRAEVKTLRHRAQLRAR